jgi:hypothetical protein
MRIARSCRIALAGLLLAVASAAHAAPAQTCSDTVLASVPAALGMQADDELRDSACKLWPDDAGRMLVALAFASPRAPNSGELQLRLALIDTTSLRPLARYRGELQEDATLTVDPGTLRLDTARYHLAPGVRAFGLVTRTRLQASCPEGGFDDVASLYVADGSTIRPLFSEDVTLKFWHYAASGDCGRDIDREADVTLAVKARAGTRADLVFTARRSDRPGQPLVLQVPWSGTHYDTRHWNASVLKWWWD